MTPDDQRGGQPQLPSEPDDDIFAISEPTGPQQRLIPSLPPARRLLVEQQNQEEAGQIAGLPAFPMIMGVFTFPFYWQSLVAWAVLALGWTACSIGFMWAHI